jgi:hypothetical protein
MHNVCLHLFDHEKKIDRNYKAIDEEKSNTDCRFKFVNNKIEEVSIKIEALKDESLIAQFTTKQIDDYDEVIREAKEFKKEVNEYALIKLNELKEFKLNRKELKRDIINAELLYADQLSDNELMQIKRHKATLKDLKNGMRCRELLYVNLIKDNIFNPDTIVCGEVVDESLIWKSDKIKRINEYVGRKELVILTAFFSYGLLTYPFKGNYSNSESESNLMLTNSINELISMLLGYSVCCSIFKFGKLTHYIDVRHDLRKKKLSNFKQIELLEGFNSYCKLIESFLPIAFASLQYYSDKGIFCESNPLDYRCQDVPAYHYRNIICIAWTSMLYFSVFKIFQCAEKFFKKQDRKANNLMFNTYLLMQTWIYEKMGMW